MNIKEIAENISEKAKGNKDVMLVVSFLSLISKKLVEGIKKASLRDLVDWISKGLKKVQEVIKGIVYGFKQFAQKIKGKFTQITRHYSKDKDQWYETEVRRTTDVENVSEDMMRGVGEEECDQTEWLENELS